MSVFFDNNITDVGRQLWAEMQAGGSFVPTRIVVGSGYLPTGKTTKTVTAVAEPVQSIQLNKSEKMSGGDYVFGGVFTNKDVTAAFYYRELALYAKVERPDGTETEETLYSYGNAGANAELIPAYSTGTAVERQLDILSYIGNDATVTVEIATGIYVSKTEFDTKFGELKEATDNSVKKVDGKNLSTNDYTDTDKNKVSNLPENVEAELEKKENAATILTGSVEAGKTTIQFTSEKIKGTSAVDIYASIYGVMIEDMQISEGMVKMKIEAQESATNMRIEVH